MSTRDSYFDVFDVYLPVALAVFVVVCGAIAFVVLRGRRRTEEPTRRKNNIPLEVGYATVLALIAAALLTLTLRVHGREVSAYGKGTAERVDVVAAKWRWTFTYPRYGIVQVTQEGHGADLVVPRGVPVDFTGRSRDVIHGFWVPEERFQRELFNDRTSDWRMTFDRSAYGGTAPCSFYCGLRHRLMTFHVRVLAPTAFRAWVRRRSS